MSSSRNGSTGRAKLDGIELEYSVGGSGEPVVFIHGSIIANYLSVLQRESILTKNYRLVSYSRRGFGGSTHPKGPLSIPEQASDCSNLMRHLNIERAHIVGHSYGGVIALQFALDYPNTVHTLSLLEPALVMQIPSGQQVMQAMMPVIELYQRGDKAGAINGFLMGVAGPEAPNLMERVIPGSMKQAVADADTLFQMDFPSIQSWNFSAEDAKRIKQPVLSVSGAETLPWMINEVNELIRRWFPQSEAVVIPNANHAFPFTNPKELAEALSGFFVRHPLQVIA